MSTLIDIQRRTIDNRLVVEVIGHEVVISQILENLENRLSEDVEEVRIFSGNIIHINKDFKNEVWHGKNVVILTNTIKVDGKVTWNVSGKDNNHTYANKADTDECGNGKDGEDGRAGESGGNVLILAKEIKNSKNLTIISNGGNGSKGQDGGNGKNGDNGKGISKYDLDEKFPCAAPLMSHRVGVVRTTILSILEDLADVKTVWYSGRGSTVRDILRDLNELEDYANRVSNVDTDAPSYDLAFYNFKENIFIKAVTNQGNIITFSFQYGSTFTNCQAFLLYEGSLGKQGKRGGKFGLGGGGGYPGEITVRNIENNEEFDVIKSAKQGQEGSMGKGGLYGKQGKNGWDMGYMDYSVSNFFTSSWPKYYGLYGNRKCTISYYNSSTSSRVWCPYHDKYAEITSEVIQHRQQQDRRENESARRINNRQRCAEAIKKRNISQTHILTTYSYHLNSAEESTLENLQSNLGNAEQKVLQTVSENHLNSTEESTLENLQSDLENDEQEVLQTVSENHLNSAEESTLENLQSDLENDEQEVLQTVSENHLNSAEESTLENLQSDLENDEQEVLQTVSENQKQQKEKTMDISIKRLIMYQRNYKRDNNFNLGTIFKEAEKENIGLLLDKLKRESLLLDNWFQLRNIEINYSELNELFSNFETVKQTFLQKPSTSNDNENEKLQTIENLLLNKYRFSTLHEIAKQLPPYQEVMDNIKLTPENVARYLQVIRKLTPPEYYISGKCEDQNLDQSLEKCDAKLSSVPELLAFVHNLNVILYVEDPDYNLVLQNNYNSSSEKMFYMLRRGDEFMELNIDTDYLELEEERKKKDDLYAKIFIEMESFKQKQEFDNYLKNKVFLSHKSPLKNEQLSDEEGCIKKLVTYFPEEERKELKERMGKIFNYTGQQGILHNMLQRFSNEGRHVPSKILYYLINSILASSIENRKEQNTFRWIVAAYPQKNWIDELILLQLENYFKKPLTEKFKWREYLSKTENKDILLLLHLKLDHCRPYYFDSTQCIEDILYLLSNILNETVNLEKLELSEWPYALKEKYWICKLTKLLDWEKSDLLTASYHLSSMENTFGTGLMEKFIEILKDKIQTSPDVFANILSTFHNEKWYLTEVELETLNGTLNVNEWIENMQKRVINEEERDIMQLVELIKVNTNNSKSISDKLSNVAESIKSICKDEYMILGKSVSSFTEDDIKNWVNKFKNTERKDILEVHKEMLAIIDRAIKLERRFQLRDTQRVAILALLTNDRTLAEVFTGEGKSLIVVAASIMKVLYGEKVHIVTSSPILAKRDAESNKDIYNLFDINVSHNCVEKIEDRKDAYSKNQVVYGDLSHFQRDYLLDKFYGKNILNNHNSKNVIIDEVDSMLLDKGNNTLYLSHDLASLNKLESVYICVWYWINTPGRDLSYTFDTKAIREAVLNDLYGLIKKEDIGQLDSMLNEQQRMNIWDRLIKAKILDSEGKLLIDSIDSKKLNDVLSPEFIKYKDRLDYLLTECIERKTFVHVPNHLKPFVEQHLESWIDSALIAFCMKEKEDYMVDVDREGISPDCNPNIIILDKDTGTDQVNSQWNEALHQFLQLKHGCKLSLQSLKAVFISNVSFFKLYKNLYGLTGTLGSQRERSLLKEIHGIDFVTIPTAKSKRFHENNPILCNSKEEWTNHIRDEVQELIEKKKRSVLIICETINDVEILHEAFGGTNAKHVHAYKRDYEEFDIAQGTKKLEQGQVIIATNLAGRGTDIQISEDLKQAGGLHVCLTYLPKNTRIEQQAFGRAARKGDKGTGQLVIIDTKGKEYSNLQILNLKRERETKELHRISDVKNYYETQIMVEEDCFKAFEKQYVELKADFERKEVPAEIIEIMLQSCLDKWAFWLDENSKYIKDLNFPDLRNIFISHNGHEYAAWVDGNPFQMIKLGKYFAQNEQCDNAIKLFDKVIKQEPYFSEAARYYKAYALSKKIDWEKKPLTSNDKELLKSLKKELRESARLLDVRSNCCATFVGIINKMITNKEESYEACPYEEQQQCLNKLYSIFSNSIDDILGHFIIPEYFVTNDVTQELAEILHEDLLREGILKKPRVKKDISNEELKQISSDYGVSTRTLRNILSEYEGRNINEKEFQKMLKEKMQLPSRGSFWKLLIEQKILNEEIKYIVVDNEKLKEVDPSLLDFLAEEVNKKRLEKQTLESDVVDSKELKEVDPSPVGSQAVEVNINRLEKPSLESDNEQIFLHAERIAEQRTHDNIFRKADFRNTIGENKYQTLIKKGIFSFNKKARIDTSKIKSVKLSHYDSISLEDFTNINITENEAKEILSKLVEQNVIEKKDGSANSGYRLKKKFDEIEQIELPFCPVYEAAVKGLLYTCFIYRGAVERIVRRLEEKEPFDSLPLMTKPHRNLMLKLLEQRIIKPITVKAEAENLEEELKSLYNETTTKHNLKLGPLAKEETIKNVIETLSWSRSTLKALKTPDSKLKPLIEFCEFANVDEVHVFFLNGLDLLIKLEEKKWTRKMLLNTAVVIAFGIVQITVGSVVLLLSKGVMTHVGSGFINQGAGDILFAIDALKSGYFSWSDYRQHKIESIAVTIASAGIGALLSRGVKVSHYGCKLASPNLIVGKNVSETCGKELIQIVGYDLVKKEVINCILSKTIEAIVFGISNALLDKFIENYLQTLCNDIASAILSDIERQLDRGNSHKIFTSLERTYRILGKQKAESVIYNITKNVFDKKSYVEEYSRLATKITNSVINGIANAVEKIGKSGATSKIPIHVINKVVVWSMRAAHILDAIQITINILNNLDKEINSYLEEHAARDSPNQNQKADTDYGRFERNITDHWKSLLRDKVGQIIKQHIVSPILEKGANWLGRYLGETIQQVYRSYAEGTNSTLFKTLKNQHGQELPNVNEEQSSDDFQTDSHTKEYQDKLMKLMAKTRNPDLFADIILEDVPMDLTCVDACVKIMSELLEQHGIPTPGMIIIVKGEGGLRQEFSSAGNGVGGRIIEMNLIDNHFQLCGNRGNGGTSRGDGNDGLKNHCLYDAFSEAYPQLRELITPDELRVNAANYIRQDPEIRNHIEQGHHRVPLRHGAFGGAYRTPSTRMRDFDSSSTENEKAVPTHLSDRLERFPRLGGIIQRISEEKGIDKVTVIEGGPSEFQDRSSNQGNTIHASHMFRARNINPELGNDKLYKEGKSEPEYNELRNTLGHTQNVKQFANKWPGVGKDIDVFQEKNLKKIVNIDYSTPTPNREAIDTLEGLKRDYIAILDNQIKNGKLSESERTELSKARENTDRITVEQLYKKGRDGYLNKHKNYQEPYRRK